MFRGGLRLIAGLVGALALAAGCNADRAWLQAAIDARAQTVGRRTEPHQVALLERGCDSLCYRLKLIREARESICIQTFIYDNDPVARLVMHELVHAARRGVRVRVIADTMFSNADVKRLAHVATADKFVQVRAFNPPNSRIAAGAIDRLGVLLTEFSRINQRMHNKVFLVDSRIAVCGGRNHADEYFDEDTTLCFRDRDIVVRGPIVADMQASFEEYWNHPRTIPLRDIADIAEQIAAQPQAEQGWPFGLKFLQCDGLSDRCSERTDEGHPDMKWYPVDRIAFWTDKPGKPPQDDDPAGVPRRLAALVGNAKREVLIQTPYLVLTPRAATLFAMLQEREQPVSVTVSTNSLAATDSWPTYAHTTRQRRMMIRDLGFRIFEMKPYPDDRADYLPGYKGLCARKRAATDGPVEDVADPTICLHAKSLVVDEQVAVVGSYNLDPRSAHFSSEVLMVVWSKELAADLAASIRHDCAPGNSWVVAPKYRPLPLDLIQRIFEEINALIRTVTTLDLWPFRHCSIFELAPGAEPCDRGDPAFYDRYVDIGQFPGLRDPMKAVLVVLTRMLGGLLRVLM